MARLVAVTEADNHREAAIRRVVLQVAAIHPVAVHHLVAVILPAVARRPAATVPRAIRLQAVGLRRATAPLNLGTVDIPVLPPEDHPGSRRRRAKR
jgi:hypothetical protein